MKHNVLLGIGLLFMTLAACKKDFLNEKPNKAILVPTTIAEAMALLDNTAVMNQVPYLGEVSADDYYSTDKVLGGFTQIKNFYTWEKDQLNDGSAVGDWIFPYAQVFYANVALETLDKISVTASNTSAFNEAKGTACFFRAFAFYGLAQHFAVPYDEATAQSVPGIIIRLSADVNLRPSRSSLKETYHQMITDLQTAVALLPNSVRVKSRPSKAAAHVLLARIYLMMEDYVAAEAHANEVLKITNKLLDYNTLNAALAKPFPVSLPNANEEVIFHSPVTLAGILVLDQTTIIDSLLYRQYEKDDLRKSLFFITRANGAINFKGTYTGSTALFGGLATDEVILIKAEAQARLNKTSEAMRTLNDLLVTRWKTGTFMAKTALNANDALLTILRERRKQLVFRGLRWPDLRRLNKNPMTATSLMRIHNGIRYELPPGDKRYTFYLPPNEISSQVVQNER